MNTFTRSVDLLQRAMDVTSLRYQVTANNLANSEVPNFKRTVVNFESELKRAFESKQKEHESFHLNATESYHFSGTETRDWRSVEPRRVTDWASTSKANGNNVDPEQEAMEVLKIQLNYQLLTQMQAFEFNQLKMILK